MSESGQKGILVPIRQHELTETAWRDFVIERLAEGQQRMEELQGQVSENTKLTKHVADTTDGVVAAFKAMTGGLKVLETIGKLAKPMLFVVGIATAAALAWQEFKHRWFP